MFLQVKDLNKKVLYESKVFKLTPDSKIDIEVRLGEDQLAEAHLPKQFSIDGIVPEEVFNTINQAIQIAAPDSFEHHQRIATSYFCGLPPVVNIPDVLNIASGVLRGRSSDIQLFNSYLDSLEIWNSKYSPSSSKHISLKEAEYLSSDQFLSELSEKLHTLPSSMVESIVPNEHRVMLIAAAIHASAGKPVQLHRNLGVIDRQFCGLHSLEHLYFMARNVFGNTPGARDVFLRFLPALGGGCGLNDAPVGSLPQPLPIPCGDPIWPPIPTPDGDFDIPDRADMWACMAEAVPSWNKAIGTSLIYEIENIEPANACPGQTITIRGRNFAFGDLSGVVRFRGRGDTFIEVTPESWSENEIIVVVPIGAHCGFIELEIPEAIRALVDLG